MEQLTLFYLMQSYQSHARVARIYRRLLRRTHRLVHRFDEADVVLLHLEPHDYAALYQQYPELSRKYVISYCVWEASKVPAAYARSLSLVQEVWTCSRYCQNILSQAHSNVQYMPHAIYRDASYTREDVLSVQADIAYDQEAFYFLCIGRTLGHRKNFTGLIDAFTRTAHQMPGARLILKGLPSDPIPRGLDSNITYLPVTFSDAEINALYQLCDCYVSPHHSEGWGLTLSDALHFRKPTIATGYSGNCEFMDDTNSFLVTYVESEIKEEHQFGLFTTDMKWAYPDETHLSAHMQTVYSSRGRRSENDKVSRIGPVIARFDLRNIENRLVKRMQEIAALL